MRNSLVILFINIFMLVSVGLFSQSLETDLYVRPVDPVINDTAIIVNDVFHTTTSAIITTDSIVSEDNIIPEDTLITEKKAFKPDANKAVWLGAVIPGYGQIVNKKYWKLPIIYGGFMGCGFAISWTSKEYKFYKTAYRDIIDNDPNTNSFMDPIPDGMTIDQIFGSTDAYINRLKSYQDSYRRYRDLSILISVIYYGLTILEAYVDAQLYDYDISPDLSMRVQPTLINNDVAYLKPVNEFDTFRQTKALGNSNAIGIQWSIRLK